MFCPFLDKEILIPDERISHVVQDHGELLPEHWNLIEEVVRDPEKIRTSSRDTNILLFSRYYSWLLRGKFVVVGIVIHPERCWMITAFIARRLSGGTLLWKKEI
jgi:hypothetical protein